MKLDHCKQHTGSDDNSLTCYHLRHDDGRPASDYEVMSHTDAQAAERLRKDAERYTKLIEYLASERTDCDDLLVSCSVKASF